MRRGVLALLAVAWALAAGYSHVRPTNFSGWDEWLVLDLTSRGLLGLPFENRPLSLLFNFVGSLLDADGLRGFRAAHGFYLWLTGACVWGLVRRLVPEHAPAAFAAGAITVAWAPMDAMRLDAVLLSNYSGVTAAVLAAALMLTEAQARDKPWLALPAAGLAFAAVRALESAAALAVLTPLLLFWMPASPSARRRRALLALAWWAVALVAVMLAARPLWPGQGPSYQVSGLGFDPRPGAVLSRLLLQFRYQFGPLVLSDPGELVAGAGPALAAAAVFAGWLWSGGAGAPAVGASPLRRLAAVGVVALTAGHGVLVLSRSMTTPARTQILSGPGAGLLLCAVALALGSLLRGRASRVVPPFAVALVVAVGTGRTVALQREWDRTTAWPAQSATLRSLTEVAPRLEPGTLVLLLDDAGCWPASFTFRHAVQYLYGPSVTGAVLDAEQFLYPIQLLPDGVAVLPYASVREAWDAPARFHSWSTVVLARTRPGGAAELLFTWPQSLPLTPGTAGYAPAGRVIGGAPAPARAAMLRH